MTDVSVRESERWGGNNHVSLAEGLPVGKKASAPSSVKGAGVDMFE